MNNRQIDQLASGEFETNLSFVQTAFYALERAAAHRLLRRGPPQVAGPVLLNLGCRPHSYEGWFNAGASAAQFNQVADPRLLRDDPDKGLESSYVFARKPAA